MSVMNEEEYKELLTLKSRLLRAEETETKEKELRTLRKQLISEILSIEARQADLEDLRTIYEEILEDL
jgi:hypothetical protein